MTHDAARGLKAYWVWHGDKDRNPDNYLCPEPTNAQDDPCFTKVYLAANVDAALNAREREVWQPFDTAPRDGTEFLVCYPNQGDTLQLVRYNTVHKYWQSKGEPCLGIASQGCLWQPIMKPCRRQAVLAG